jgi:hypothetical protein
MKRLFVAAGLAMAALSLPATAALADGYVRTAPKPKPKPKPRAALKHHAKKAYRRHEPVRDYAAVYCCQRSHASYSFEQMEKVESSYYEESSRHRYGPVVSYSESYVNPSRGCYPNAPCGYSTGPHVPAHFYYGGHPGGVGYGVDGGPVYSGQAMFIVPGGGYWSHHAHGAAGAAASAYGSAHGYYGGQGYGHPGAAYPPTYGHPGYPHPGMHHRPSGKHPWGKHPGKPSWR